jgi:alpha-tubulin suppressor-like RCC1 family protein
MTFVFIQAFFSDEFIFTTDLTAGTLDLAITDIAIQAASNQNDFITPDTEGSPTALINTNEILNFRFTLINQGYSAAKVQPQIALSWDASLPETGNLLLFPATLSDKEIMTAITSSDFSRALINPTFPDTTDITTSTLSRQGMLLTLDELILDSSHDDGQHGYATIPNENKQQYQFKLIFLDTNDVAANTQLFNQTPLEINLIAHATTATAANNWQTSAQTFFRLNAHRFTGLEYDLSYSPSNLTQADVTVTLTTNYPIATPSGWLANHTNQTFTRVYNDNNDLNPDIFTITELKGRGSQKITVSISNIDRDAPKIILQPPNPYYLDKSYQEPGYTLTDNKDPQPKITITGVNDINTSSTGEYLITYTASDSVGNTSTVTRSVIVEETFTSKIMAALSCSSPGLANCRYPATATNNYVWYSGFLWRILGVNDDRSVRLITQESIAQIPYSTNNRTFTGSLMESWLNNYFVPQLFAPERFLVAAPTCNSTYTSLARANTVTNVTCTNTYKISPLVGLLSVEDYNQLRGNATTNFLLNGNYFATISGNSSTLYLVPPTPTNNGNLVDTSAVNFVATRPVINIAPNIRLRGGDGSYDPAVNWDNTIGPFQFANYNLALPHETRLNERQPGEFIKIGNYRYRLSRVLTNGDTRLILDDFITENSAPKLISFHSTPHENATLFTPTDPNNIGYYLNQTVLPLLFPTTDPNRQDQTFIRQNITYYQGNPQNTGSDVFNYALADAAAFTSSIALPRLGEIMTAPSQVIPSNNFWTMTKSNQNNHLYQISPDGTALSNAAFTPTDTAALRPSVTIKKQVVIKQGEGTINNPFELEVYRPIIDPLYSKNVDWFAGDHHTPLDLIIATDINEGNITSSVTYQATPTFDPLTPGDYTITYNVTDSHATPALPLTIKVRVWNFIKIETGWYHSLALTSHGKVYAWGYNGYGQIGDNTTTSRSIPQQVSTNLDQQKVIDIAAGWHSSYALTKSGEIYAWGSGSQGALGTGNTANRSTPTLINLPATIRFTQISSFNQTVAALTTTGQVYVWGDGAWGALGTGNTTDVLSPLLLTGLDQVLVLSQGEYHGVAYTSSGELCTWGNNSYGQQALGYTSSLYTYFTPTCRPSFAPIKQLASAHDFSLALTESGQAYAWGRGEGYRLGTGSTNNSSSPTLLNLSDVTYLTCGSYHSLFVTASGNVYGVGSNSYGKLGLGNSTTQQNIAQTTFFDQTNHRSAFMVSGGYDSSCVLTAQNLVYCFGYGGEGGLGTGSNTSYNTPQTWAFTPTPLAPTVFQTPP